METEQKKAGCCKRCCSFQRYLGCINLDSAITIIGLSHINVALWWFWSFTTFPAVYLWFDLAICLTYVARSVAFLHGCYRDDMLSTYKSRAKYHLVNWVSSIFLAILVIG